MGRDESGKGFVAIAHDSFVGIGRGAASDLK